MDGPTVPFRLSFRVFFPLVSTLLYHFSLLERIGICSNDARCSLPSNERRGTMHTQNLDKTLTKHHRPILSAGGHCLLNPLIELSGYRSIHQPREGNSSWINWGGIQISNQLVLPAICLKSRCGITLSSICGTEVIVIENPTPSVVVRDK